MIRLTYISRFSENLSPADIQAIGEVSSKNNKNLDITGILLASNDMFFQILEGEENKVLPLYQKIIRDRRHKDFACLSRERKVETRIFAGWNMNTVNLDTQNDRVLVALKTILNGLAKSHQNLEKFAPAVIVKGLEMGEDLSKSPAVEHENVILHVRFGAVPELVAKHGAAEVHQTLTRFFNSAAMYIKAKGGDVYAFSGDALEGAFSSLKPGNAVGAVQEILKDLSRPTGFEKIKTAELKPYFGLAYGKVMEGSLGNRARVVYGAWGPTKEMAGLLSAEGQKNGEVLMVNNALLSKLDAPPPSVSKGKLKGTWGVEEEVLGLKV